MGNQALLATTGQDYAAQELNAIARHGGDLFWCPTLTQQNSSTFINIAGISFDFTKQFADTYLLVDMSVSIYTDTAGAEAQIGISYSPSVGAVVCGHLNFNEVAKQNSVAGVATLAIAAGAYSLQPMMCRSAGTGFVIAAAGQPVYLSVREVLL